MPAPESRAVSAPPAGRPFGYLEGDRAQPLARRDLPDAERRWWPGQRRHGRRAAVRPEAAERDLAPWSRGSGTARGRRPRRRRLRHAVPVE